MLDLVVYLSAKLKINKGSEWTKEKLVSMASRTTSDHLLLGQKKKQTSSIDSKGKTHY